jgi:hypothetical protein
MTARRRLWRLRAEHAMPVVMMAAEGGAGNRRASGGIDCLCLAIHLSCSELQKFNDEACYFGNFAFSA